MVSLIIYNK